MLHIHDLQQLSVLLVDDNLADQVFIEKMLKRSQASSHFSLQWQHAESLEAAAAIVDQNPPDLVLLDLNLLRSRGIETLRSFRKQFQELPVIVLTGALEQDLGLQAIREGAQEYLIKDQIDEQSLKRAMIYSFERWRLQKERAKVQLLEQVAASKLQFVSMVSHELRTPLTAIKDGIELLLEERQTLSADQVDTLQIVEASIQRLARLVNDVLDYSRMDAGKMRWVAAPCDLAQRVQRVAELMRQTLQIKGLELKLDCPASLVCVCDGDKIEQVLLNLVQNAYKFTDKGWVMVKVAQENEQVVFQVSDTGRGIPEEKREKVFEMFEQAHPSTGLASLGAGLGLALCQKIVHAHGGSIHVASSGSQGSSIVFTLPRRCSLPSSEVKLA